MELEEKWKEFQNWRKNEDPKIAPPDIIFECFDCETHFRIQDSNRESCPACGSKKIQCDDYLMLCGGGKCWIKTLEREYGMKF